MERDPAVLPVSKHLLKTSILFKFREQLFNLKRSLKLNYVAYFQNSMTVTTCDTLLFKLPQDETLLFSQLKYDWKVTKK